MPEHTIDIPKDLYERLQAACPRSDRPDFDRWLDCEIEARLSCWSGSRPSVFDPAQTLIGVRVSPEVYFTLGGIATAESRLLEGVCATAAAEVLANTEREQRED
jgi:hypothetical protein